MKSPSGNIGRKITSRIFKARIVTFFWSPLQIRFTMLVLYSAIGEKRKSGLRFRIGLVNLRRRHFGIMERSRGCFGKVFPVNYRTSCMRSLKY